MLLRKNTQAQIADCRSLCAGGESEFSALVQRNLALNSGLDVRAFVRLGRTAIEPALYALTSTAPLVATKEGSEDAAANTNVYAANTNAAAADNASTALRRSLEVLRDVAAQPLWGVGENPAAEVVNMLEMAFPSGS